MLIPFKHRTAVAVKQKRILRQPILTITDPNTGKCVPYNVFRTSIRQDYIISTRWVAHFDLGKKQ